MRLIEYGRRGAYLTELHVGVVRRLSEGISEALGGTMLYLISAMFGAHLSFYSSRSSLRICNANAISGLFIYVAVSISSRMEQNGID